VYVLPKQVKYADHINSQFAQLKKPQPAGERKQKLIEVEIETLTALLSAARGSSQELKLSSYFAVVEPLAEKDSVKNYLDVLVDSVTEAAQGIRTAL
jgi:hypothetical protein